MKHPFFITIFCFTCLWATSQSNKALNGLFKKENVFTGGTLNLAFSDQISSLGISPYIGYSFNKYIDVAASTGINYTSQRDYQYQGDKLRQTIFTPGAFIRLFPMKFLFTQVQYEYNIIQYKYIGTYTIDDALELNVPCLLVGAGISNGKNFPQQKSYYYFSILWDKGNAANSPYKDNLRRPLPIIRAGYHIALFQGKR